MEAVLPKITLVKQREIGEGPTDSASLGLDQTLQMLCSFYTSEDLGSFLGSEVFIRYARQSEPWVVLEIGIYKDHTKTVELIPSKEEFVIADAGQSGVFENHLWRGLTAEDVVIAVNRWIGAVHP